MLALAQTCHGGSNGADDIIKSRAQKRKKKEEDADFIAVMLATKLDGLTKANLRDAINGTVAMIAQRSLEKIRAKDDSEKAQIELLIQPLRDELAETKRMYDESFDS
ncbi:hypothetical protein MPSEU_000266500 [Mayamaea pseudoterrestris]|nr:hypothetical protein MPSEU_000266500 [Mayamaea pseudoterrestris]